MAQLTSQMRSLINGHIRGVTVKPGSTYWATLADAQYDIDNRLGKLANVDQPAAISDAYATALAPVEVPEKKVLARKDGWPTDRFSTVVRSWEGRTVVCIASGPSLTTEQLEIVRRARAADQVRVIVTNSTYQKAPWADLLYFADSKWWKWHNENPEYRDGFWAFPGLKCTVWLSGNEVRDAKVHMLRVYDGVQALSQNPEYLATGSNAGHQIVNIASLTGAAKIPLLGFDAKAGPSGQKHHHPDHPDGTEAPYAAMLAHFPRLAVELGKIGVEVVNCSPGSALKCFPVGRIEEILAA